MLQLIAKRDVEIKHGEEFLPGSIEVFMPELHPADEKGAAFWQCRFKLEFAEEEYSRDICGQDSFQALQLALRMLPTQIESSSTFRAGQLHLWGEPLTDVDLLFTTDRFGDA